MDIALVDSVLQLDEQTGSISDWRVSDRSLLQQRASLPLFTLQFRNAANTAMRVTAFDAANCAVTRTQTDGETHVILHFTQFSILSLQIDVHIRSLEHDTLTYWRLTSMFDVDATLEWVSFPGIIAPNDLIGAGGDAHLIWPALEGTRIEDAHLRNRTWMTYDSEDYPSKGWDGMYPAASTTQMLAYCTPAGGLYAAAHDSQHTPKRIEYVADDDHNGIRLEYRVFPGSRERGRWEMDYDMVLGTFHGDWYDAASIYRRWWDTVSGAAPAPTAALPSWLQGEDEPLIVIYPIRGTHDTGDMSPNEYFPYDRALPTIEGIAQRLDTRVLVLLMHWEGTAPWAPPYVWPPFGGKDAFTQFAAQLHERGHLLGVYASGIGWTQESTLVAYDRRAQFNQERLRAVMCLSPTGDLPWSHSSGPQRWGYDMCPSQPFVTEVVNQEIAHLAASGCDYAQFFDQQSGGTSYFCYSHDHDHPLTPGSWQVAAMQQVYAAAQQAAGATMVLGCEGAAAPPYQRHLPINDDRAHMAFWVGQPVPLHAFLYHGHTHNFMGNQVYIHATLDGEASPENFAIRLAYAFLSGDLLTVTLGAGGVIQWGWCTPWEITPPDQEQTLQLLATLLAWRKGSAHEFLTTGRMEKPYPVATAQIDLQRVDGSRIPWPAVMTNCWSLPDGRHAQILVNPWGIAHDLMLHLPPALVATAYVVIDQHGESHPLDHGADRTLSMTMAPHAVAMVLWQA